MSLAVGSVCLSICLSVCLFRCLSDACVHVETESAVTYSAAGASRQSLKKALDPVLLHAE